MQQRHLEWDLVVIDILTLLLIIITLVFPVPIVREVLGLLFILYFPGYVLVVSILPRQKNLGTITRIALSLCLSIAVSVFIGLTLGATPIGFTFNSILTAISVFILVISGLAWYLRNRQRHVDISGLKTPSFLTDAIQSYRIASWGYRILVIILLCVIFGGLGSLGYVFARPQPSQSFSEFYVLDTAGKAEAYPRELRIGEEGRVIIAVVSHETQDTSYTIQVRVDGTNLYDLPEITLKPDEKWQQDVGFTLREAGENQKVEFILNNIPNTFETRYIWVNVIE